MEAKQALLRWAALQWPDERITTLEEVAQKTDDSALKKQTLLLSEALYNPAKQGRWSGKSLWKAITRYRKTKRTKRSMDNLPPINPS